MWWGRGSLVCGWQERPCSRATLVPSDLLPQHLASKKTDIHLSFPACASFAHSPSRSRNPHSPQFHAGGRAGESRAEPPRTGSGPGKHPAGSWGGRGGRRKEAPGGRPAGAGLAGAPPRGRDGGGWGRGQEASRGPAGRRGPVTSLGFQGSLPEAPGPRLPPSPRASPPRRGRHSSSQLAGGPAPASQPPSLPPVPPRPLLGLSNPDPVAPAPLSPRPRLALACSPSRFGLLLSIPLPPSRSFGLFFSPSPSRPPPPPPTSPPLAARQLAAPASASPSPRRLRQHPPRDRPAGPRRRALRGPSPPGRPGTSPSPSPLSAPPGPAPAQRPTAPRM